MTLSTHQRRTKGQEEAIYASNCRRSPTHSYLGKTSLQLWMLLMIEQYSPIYQPSGTRRFQMLQEKMVF